VNQHTGITTRYFPHYEALEDAFRRRIATLLPRKHAGTDLFWQDFQKLFHALPELRLDHGEHYITSNPRDCLAFGTPRQVLQAALMTAASSGLAPGPALETVATRFGLQSHLSQPVRSLSGGETVRLALAKAFIGATRAGRLTLASPFSWLSLNNRRYFYDLAAHCREQGQALEVFALEGEDSSTLDEDRTEITAGPAFRVFFRQTRVVLNSLLDQLQNRRLLAAIADGDFSLQSPCLIQGDNGQGKSLVAKVLAGAMPREGQAGIDTEGRSGRVRLLLQDLVNQAMMRSFRQLAAGASGTAGAAARHYDAIRADMLADRVRARDAIRTFEDGCAARTPASLLELKILLAALRLAVRPAAIVLDEPDWGLRQSSAQALVRGVIRTAHGVGVPVLLITHKSWWRRWAGSCLQVRKMQNGSAEAVTELFRIQLEKAGPCA
jgi:energy-coupling factor transporter ATP-binding protein EcfA2